MAHLTRLPHLIPAFAEEMGISGISSFALRFPTYVHPGIVHFLSDMYLEDAHYSEIMKLCFLDSGSLISDSPGAYYVNWLASRGYCHSLENFKFFVTGLIVHLAQAMGTDLWKDGVARTLENPYQEVLPLRHACENITYGDDASSLTTIPSIKQLRRRIAELRELETLRFAQSLEKKRLQLLSGIQVPPVVVALNSGGTSDSTCKTPIAEVTKRSSTRKRCHNKSVPSTPSAPVGCGDQAIISDIGLPRVSRTWSSYRLDSGWEAAGAKTQKGQASNAVRKRC